MADQMIPVKKGVDKALDIIMKTRSASAFSRAGVKNALPIIPIAIAAINEIRTHTIAI